MRSSTIDLACYNDEQDSEVVEIRFTSFAAQCEAEAAANSSDPTDGCNSPRRRFHRFPMLAGWIPRKKNTPSLQAVPPHVHAKQLCLSAGQAEQDELALKVDDTQAFMWLVLRNSKIFPSLDER
jgi:hypothetical protein